MELDSDDNYSSIKDSSFSMSKIYSNDKIEILKRRIDFISTRRKKNWISIEPINTNTNYQQACCYQSRANKDGSQQSIKNEGSSRVSHSKTKSVELMDLKTKRYQECKENSERIQMKIELRRLDEIQTKRLKRMRIVYDHQRAREQLQAYQAEKIKKLQQSHVKNSVDEVLALKTVQIKQNLIKEEQQQLQQYQNQLSYRSQVMRKIKQMISKSDES